MEQPPNASLDSAATDSDADSGALHRMVAALVLETTSAGIWLIDAQARTTYVNRHAAALLGYTEEEMIGMHIFSFMDEERRPVAQQNLMLRQRGVEDRQEVKLRRKDGTDIWVIGSTNPVYDRNGQYAGALGILGDLTLQKAREEKLQSEVERLVGTPAAARPAPSASSARVNAVQEAPSYREPFRTAIVLGALGGFVAAAGLIAAGEVVSTLLRASRDDL